MSVRLIPNKIVDLTIFSRTVKSCEKNNMKIKYNKFIIEKITLI